MEQVEQAWKLMEEDSDRIFRMLETYTPQAINQQPAPGKWSALQVLFHLNSSESLSLAYMQKKSLGGNRIPRANVSSAVRSMALNTALKYFKWKKPQLLPDPPPELNLEEVRQSWKATRKQLYEFLRNLPPDMLQRQIYRHPAAGRMNAIQALSFMHEHFKHHEKQLLSALKQN
jgi:uncharacterized damage-inducible protein DinB